jgi:hypothetical protein
MLLIGFCKIFILSQSCFVNKYFLLFFFSDRFRTAINVFGDAIGCAIVQHLSRKELSALDNKETANPLIVSDAKHGTNTSNHVVTTTTYDNPTFIIQSETYDDDKENMIVRTNV